jgi:hypothetical protein
VRQILAQTGLVGCGKPEPAAVPLRDRLLLLHEHVTEETSAVAQDTPSTASASQVAGTPPECTSGLPRRSETFSESEGGAS